MITVDLPTTLHPYAGNSPTVALDRPCATVAQVMAALGERWPGVVDRVLTEQGAIRSHVNIFVGAESVRHAGGLAAPVAEGDTVSIIAAVSGG